MRRNTVESLWAGAALMLSVFCFVIGLKIGYVKAGGDVAESYDRMIDSMKIEVSNAVADREYYHRLAFDDMGDSTYRPVSIRTLVLGLDAVDLNSIKRKMVKTFINGTRGFDLKAFERDLKTTLKRKKSNHYIATGRAAVQSECDTLKTDSTVAIDSAVFYANLPETFPFNAICEDCSGCTFSYMVGQEEFERLVTNRWNLVWWDKASKCWHIRNGRKTTYFLGRLPLNRWPERGDLWHQ